MLVTPPVLRAVGTRGVAAGGAVRVAEMSMSEPSVHPLSSPASTWPCDKAITRAASDVIGLIVPAWLADMFREAFGT